MHRETNPPEEMFRRLFYVIYLALLAGTALSGTIALAQSRPGYLVVALFLGFLSLRCKHYGKRYLDFDRLFRSFPYGEPADDISPAFRMEIEEIIRESHMQDIGWIVRQELRQRLAELVEKDARLFEIYREEIAAIHPTLAAKADQHHNAGQD